MAQKIDTWQILCLFLSSEALVNSASGELFFYLGLLRAKLNQSIQN